MGRLRTWEAGRQAGKAKIEMMMKNMMEGEEKKKHDCGGQSSEVRREAKVGSLAPCSCCGEPGGRRCSGCYLVSYCGVACQREDRKEHREECKEARAKYMVATLTKEPVAMMTSPTKRELFQFHCQQNPRGQFVVKVQPPWPHMDPALFLCNKTRSLHGVMVRAGQEELYDKLDKDIRHRGIEQAFYSAICKRDAADPGGYIM